MGSRILYNRHIISANADSVEETKDCSEETLENYLILNKEILENYLILNHDLQFLLLHF